MSPSSHPVRSSRLLLPAISTGVLMAVYLLVRPYGDSGPPAEAAATFGSRRWVVAHVCGMLALAGYAWLTVRLTDLVQTPLGTFSRWAGLGGLVLVLPYYGAETFGLYAIGRRAMGDDPDSFELVAQVQNNPIALAMFGLGLALLAAAGVSFALNWQRTSQAMPAAAWPLGIGVALLLPQFYLPPTGRMGFAVAYLLASAILCIAILADSRTQTGARVPSR